MPPQRRQQHVDRTHIYIQMFCGSLCGFGLLMLICTTPLNWVRFLVIKNGLELYAGLWISCSHELCWSRTPQPPCLKCGTDPSANSSAAQVRSDHRVKEYVATEGNLNHLEDCGEEGLQRAEILSQEVKEEAVYLDYLQFSRAFFLISVFSILVALAWLISSCLPRRGSITTNLDLKVSILSFISAISLLLCLVLFLAQVHWHAKNALEPDLLWAYHINWWSDFLYMFSGIISFLNHITFRFPSLDRNVGAIPIEQSRLGVGPVTTVESGKDERLSSDKESPVEEEKTDLEAEP